MTLIRAYLTCISFACVLFFLTFVLLASASGTAVETIRYGYDHEGQITVVTYDDGTVAGRVYDRSGNRMFQTITAGTLSNNPPAPASNTSAYPDGSSGVPTNPALSWSGSDPDGDEIYYILHFGECSGNLNAVYSGYPTDYQPGQLNSFDAYCWQVVSRDSHNAETAGPVWSFNTMNDAPAAPVYQSPSDGTAVYTSTAILKWSGSDPNPDDTLMYNIYFGTSSTPPLHHGGYAGTSLSVGNLALNTTYFWKVEARDTHGASSMGTEQSFTTSRITPGQIIYGFHGSNTEEHTYKITLSAGEIIMVRAGFVTLGADLYIRILDTDGTTLLCDEYKDNFKIARHSAEITGCSIAAAGEYTIIVSELNNNETGGDYILRVERLNNTAVTSSSGEVLARTLLATPDMNAHTFAGSANDSIIIRMGFAADGPDTHIRLFDPAGNAVACSGIYGAHKEISRCVLPEDGTYTIIASEYEGDETGGDYHLTFERLRNAAASMLYGDSVAGTLAVISDLGVHTFTAIAGDRIKVKMGFSSKGADPEVRIFDPAGAALVCSMSRVNTINDNYSAEIQSCLLPESGVYTVIASEDGVDETGGDYTLTIVRLNNTAPTVSYGETFSGALQVISDINVHTFTAGAGDRVRVMMGFAAAGPDPLITIYDPSGTPVSSCSGQILNNSSSVKSAEIKSCPIQSAGIYTIAASELNGDETGAYSITMERLNNTAATIAYGQTDSDALAVASDINVHIFSAGAGDMIMVRMGFAAAGPDPQFSIYDPGGSSISCDKFKISAYNYSAERTGCLIPAAGIYTVVASEYEGDETGGDYSLTVERLNNSADTMTYGQTVSGNLAATADIDKHTFIAMSNDSVNISMGFSANGPDPQIRVFGADVGALSCQGHHINNGSSNSSAIISGCLIPVDGTYTIIAAEYNGDETGGAYNLTLECITGVCNIPPMANAGGPYAGVEGQAVTLDGSQSDDPGGTITYEWDIDNDGTYDYGPSSSPFLYHNWTMDGIYTVKLKVADNNSETDESTAVVTVLDSLPTAAFDGTPLSGPEALSVNFTDRSTGYDQPLSYAWDFENDGTPDSTARAPLHIYSSQGLYTVRLTVTDADGSTGTLTRTDYVTVSIPGCSNPPVKTGTAHFYTLHDSYVSAQDGDLIMVRAEAFTENLDLDRNIALTLRGGYDCEYSDGSGITRLRGTMNIQGGSLVLDAGKVIIE